MPKNQIPIRLDYYLESADTWERIIKELIGDDILSIIDVCPGWSPKIAMALTRIPYTGVYTAVDISEDNLTVLDELIKPFKKQFRTQRLLANVLEPLSLQGDIIILNHALDDLILYYHLARVSSCSINPYISSEKLKMTWNEIEEDSEKYIAELAEVLIQQFKRISSIHTKILISQYLGYQESLYGLEKAYKISISLLDRIVASEEITCDRKTEQIIDNVYSNLNFKPYFRRESISTLSVNSGI